MLPETSVFDAVVGYAPVKALLPVPVLLLAAPVMWAFFRKTWRELDEEARRAASSATPEVTDYRRPAVCLIVAAVVLTLHEYYGGRAFYESTLRPILQEFESEGARHIHVEKYDELYSYAWWSLARIVGYTLVPLTVWKFVFPHDKVLDMGLRVRGFLGHVWIYALCLMVVLGAMAVVARQPDFLAYYPFYKQSSRSWSDLGMWWAMYFAQFFALEFFFRGWMLASLRKTMGAAAIFVMAVPYCMIHFGKPYLEAHAAIVAGVVLGSLSMRTRSIYAGFLVHVTVAGLMDFFALWTRGALPSRLWPG